MKTPREILLNQHRIAETRLNQIRREVVANLRHKETAARETPLLLAAALKLWRELVLPARMAWAGIAAVWVVIGILSLSQFDQTTVVAKVSTTTIQELRAASEQRRELMLELALLPTTEPAMPPKQNPQPRSERNCEFLNA